MPIQLLLSFIIFFSAMPVQAEEISVTTSSQSEISVSVFKAGDSAPVLLWLPTEYGLRGREDLTALDIARKGIEVWVADLHGSYFLPHGRSSYNNISTDDIAELIIAASNQQTREVILFATGRAAPIALKATRQLQLNKNTKNIVNSAILLHPNFYMNTTNVGDNIRYQPITQATNLAIYILQPALSGKAYQLKTLTTELQKGGSDVMSQIIPGVGDGFNVREPENKTDEKAYLKLPSVIYKATTLLSYFKKQRQAVKLASNSSNKNHNKLNSGLQPYRGNIKELFLDFNDRKNQRHTLSKHKGEVILINFWASWCPPCVKELPSLDRLQKEINSDSFTVLAVNIGEDQKTVSEFLAPMNLSFPVLFDAEGISVKPWNLLAFPSSFLIDRKGKIRYGLFGGIEWDNKEVIEIIRKLQSEK